MGSQPVQGKRSLPLILTKTLVEELQLRLEFQLQHRHALGTLLSRSGLWALTYTTEDTLHREVAMRLPQVQRAAPTSNYESHTGLCQVLCVTHPYSNKYIQKLRVLETLRQYDG